MAKQIALDRQVDPIKLALAAKAAVALITLVHETIWSLYPDELLTISESSQDMLARILLDALEDNNRAC